MQKTISIRSRLPKSRKFIMIFFVTTGIFGLSFYKIPKSTSMIGPMTFVSSQRQQPLCSSINSYRLLPSEIACNECRLSLRESDGWFCELDKEWQRRKNRYYIQDRNNYFSDDATYFFLENWHPTIQCELERRMGTGDGGKWVCDVHKFKSISSPPPLIYSFGSRADFAFEHAMKKEVPQSEIHTFDQNALNCPANICVFHQTVVGDGKSNRSKSLQMIVDDLNHQGRDIDILKVDIEGSEFELFDELFKPIIVARNELQSITTKTLSYIRQILVEIHIRSDVTKSEIRRVHAFFERFRQNNYAIFHKEANLAECQRVFEYAFIRLNPAFFTVSKALSK